MNLFEKGIYYVNDKIVIAGGDISESGDRIDYVVYSLRGVTRKKAIVLTYPNNP